MDLCMLGHVWGQNLINIPHLAPIPCKNSHTIFVIFMLEQREPCRSQLRFIVSHLKSYHLKISGFHLIDASIVCSRAKNHYNPNERVPEADSNLVDKADKDLEYHKAAFKPLHREMENSMYFSVGALRHELSQWLTSVWSDVLRYISRTQWKSFWFLESKRRDKPIILLLMSISGEPPHSSIQVCGIAEPGAVWQQQISCFPVCGSVQ